MSLTPRTRLGPYEILAEIGSGGMGEVYRARDRKLGREVAVKVLPRTFADHPERVARFEREARVLAALNHPHIAAIYGFEEADGVRALILELVEGPTLADRLRTGAMSSGEALPVAREIAEALEAAHEKGIVHRDLKPANIKLTPDGAVKVLDFGLAKMRDTAIGEDASEAATVTAAGTRAGAVLGTAAYMSPEQARGQSVDKRTDLWAFGCVLYEMLTGRAAFLGATVSDTIAAILEREPDWTRLPESTPAGVRRLLRRCLSKDAKQRFRDIGDVRIEIEETLAPGVDTAPGAERRATSRPGLRWAPATAVVVAAMGIGVLLWRLNARAVDTALLVTRTMVTLPADQVLDTRDRAAPLALSPDGRRLAYVAYSAGHTQLYLRDLDSFEARPMSGTDGAQYPFFSPDGQWVAFFAEGKLKRVSIHSGSPVTVCEAPVIGRGGTWGPDGSIVFDPGDSGLMRVVATGGNPEPVTSQDPVMDAHNLSWPHFLPNGRALLATVSREQNDVVVLSVVVLSLDTNTWRELVHGVQGQYVSSGHLVFHAPSVREGELQAVAFDATRLAIHGEPVSALDGVFRSQEGGGAYFAVAESGILVFAPGGHARTLVRVDRNGRRTPLLDVRRGFRFPSVSPDGRHVAVTIDPRPSQIWIYDIARQSGIPLATDGHNILARWTPDSRRIAYYSRGDMYWRAADASSEAQLLLTRNRAQYPMAWSRDGLSLVFQYDQGSTNRRDIWVLPVGGDPRPLLATSANEAEPTLSPDDRWLAYMSDESGHPEVYVRPFPNVDDGKWVVSTGGGGFPVWSPTGGELFYLNGTTMMSVRVEAPVGMFTAGTPEPLFTGPFETGSPPFDISPDGTYFVMVEAQPDARPSEINVVLNWHEELKRLVAGSP